MINFSKTLIFPYVFCNSTVSKFILNLIIFRGTGRKIVFHEYAAKLINPVNPPPPPHHFLTKFVVWYRTAKLGIAWRLFVGTTGNPHERPSQAMKESLVADLGNLELASD